MRGGDELVRPHLSQHGQRAVLVLGVRIGVDEGDGDGLSTPLQQTLRRGTDLVDIERPVNAAVGQCPLIHLDAHVTFSDRNKIAPQAPGLPPIPPAHFQCVAEATRRDDADLRTAALQQRVGADGRAVHDGIHASGTAQRIQAIEKTDRLVAAP